MNKRSIGFRLVDALLILMMILPLVGAMALQVLTKPASDDIKHQIADVSTLVAEKMLEREIDSDDQRKFIDSFIEGIGDGDGSDK